MENLVYLHLRRRDFSPEYYFTQSGLELDFVVPPKTGKSLQLIQACWTLRNPDTRLRELKALEEAMRELRVKEGTIITWLEEEDPQEGIRVLPAWKWMLFA